MHSATHAAINTNPTHMPDRVICFSTLVPGSGSFQLPDFAGFGLWVRVLEVFTIIVSLTLTLTLITTLTVISP